MIKSLLPGQRVRFILAALAGLLYPPAFAPIGWYVLAPLSLALLLVLMDQRTPRQAGALGFSFGFSAFLTGIYWITISVHSFGGAPLGLAIFLMLALVAFMALYFALASNLTQRLSASGRVPLWLVFPSVFIALEWVRGWFLSGFGWLSPGYTAIDSPLGGLLPVTGMLSAGWVVCLTAAAISLLILHGVRQSLPALTLTLVAWSLAAALTFVSWTHDDGSRLSAALVQGAVPQDLKWQPDQLQPTIRLYLDLSSVHLENDLVIWPEAAIPRYRHALESLWKRLEKMAFETDTQFLVGTVEYNAEEDQRYNSITAFGAPVFKETGARQSYRKRHLVPFGEYFPVPEFVREQMRMMNLPNQDFTKGGDEQKPLQVAGHRIAASICYEDVFGHELRALVPNSNLLVNVSNDAWFGGSLAPHQHLQIARVRTAELGRMMLRATNNGISAVIDRNGKVLDQSPQFVPFVLTAEVQGSIGLTPYTRWGDWPIVVLSLLGCVLGLRRMR